VYFGNAAEGSKLNRSPIGATIDNVYVVNPSTVADVRVNFTRLAETHGLPSTGFNPTSLGYPGYIAGDSTYLQMPVIGLTNVPEPGGERCEQLPVAVAPVFRRRGENLRESYAQVRRRRPPVPHEFYCRRLFNRDFSFANTWVRASSSASSTVAQGQDLASLAAACLRPATMTSKAMVVLQLLHRPVRSGRLAHQAQPDLQRGTALGSRRRDA